MSRLVADLLALGHELVETHVSWVFLSEGRAFKVKKPVSLGFLDFSSLEARRVACEREVVLNRRYSPAVYLGVVPVVLRHGVHRLGGAGPVVDWAVEMVRLPSDARADVLLRRLALDRTEVRAIAECVASFHEQATVNLATARAGSREAIEANVRENFRQASDLAAALIGERAARAIEVAQLGFLARESERFDERVRRQRVRDTHGDLRLEQIYLLRAPDGRIDVTLTDCIEFDDRYRHADVCADIAFLAMDLFANDRADLAEHCIGCYAIAADDFDAYRVVDFYLGYRAYVRAKIAALVACDEQAPAHVRREKQREARRLFLLALAFTRPSLHPSSIVCVGGVVGAGKSTVAELIAGELAAPVVSTDRVRRRLAREDRPAFRRPALPFRGAYRSSTTAAVYRAVLERAQLVVSSGRAVVVDASFRSRWLRRSFLSRVRERPWLFVECRAPFELCRERVRARYESGAAESDAHPAMVDEFLERWQPVVELDRDHHVVVDTSHDAATVRRIVRVAIRTWLARGRRPGRMDRRPHAPAPATLADESAAR